MNMNPDGSNAQYEYKQKKKICIQKKNINRKKICIPMVAMHSMNINSNPNAYYENEYNI